MERLYTPWRLDYVSSEKEEGCIFCNRLESNDPEHFILHKSRNWFLVMNRYPYSNGHVLIVSNRHIGSLIDCNDQEISDLAMLMKITETAVRKVYNPHGVNCGYNGGAGAGAGIPDHFHVHMLPRWNADTNFMTVIADTRVVPETLEKSFNNLKPVFDELLKGSEL
jgi:ATP adenylyltransferase